MTSDHSARYAALVARDCRFDGRFFVGVSSTGIYCRPVCRVRTPKAANCNFFENAAAAEAAGFRPCLRCRPELAPGLASVDMPSRLAWAAAQRIEAGQVDADGLAGLATRLGITDRHLRRVFSDAFGVTPIAYLQTQRLLLAKRLLADTALPITELALAAGFGSLRRFNAVFHAHYGLSPSALRKAAASPPAGDFMRFELAYRPPFDWPRLLAFLAGRCVPGVEAVEGGCYRRSVRVEFGGATHRGWLAITLATGKDAVAVSMSNSLVRVLPAVLAGVRRVCDLSCEPDAVARALGPLAADAPGLRVPGAFDGFEMAVRAVLGQQVTVKAAHTLAGRFAAALGEPVETPFADINRLFPAPHWVAQASVDEIASLGIVRQRTAAILSLAREVAAGRLDIGPAADVDATLGQLQALPGIGRWTAQYIALRALGWPDAWPSGDVALIKSLGVATAREADAAAEAWRPWRGYATLHLWRRLNDPSTPVGDLR
ncbi:helix-turn-helix domain-containing protein [Niveibacterium sp. 24ML]|uniref:DNA-3-methyladenine glycosylase 2 family protein n=1 Tax=Niveibacterium sp. 24ML TaxID=2985512 RepID=UPI00226DC845|nr:AlkA N-terminal domain-containing protein [Niveibacterium sp. 24ML]MCX9156467.1 helix-turn-helix domain-containing protein [Niveibacterium sp. 24ML]